MVSILRCADFGTTAASRNVYASTTRSRRLPRVAVVQSREGLSPLEESFSHYLSGLISLACDGIAIRRMISSPISPMIALIDRRRLGPNREEPVSTH